MIWVGFRPNWLWLIHTGITAADWWLIDDSPVDHEFTGPDLYLQVDYVGVEGRRVEGFRQLLTQRL